MYELGSIAAFEKLGLAKSAGPIAQQRRLLGALSGAALGGTGGALLGGDEHRLRGGALGALGGAAAGAGLGTLYNKVNPVRMGKPYINAQPLDNTAPQIIHRGMGHRAPSGVLNEFDMDTTRAEDVARLSDAYKKLKPYKPNLRRSGKDILVEVYPNELDSAGRLSPAHVLFPGGAEQDPNRLFELARRYAAKTVKDRTF